MLVKFHRGWMPLTQKLLESRNELSWCRKKWLLRNIFKRRWSFLNRREKVLNMLYLKIAFPCFMACRLKLMIRPIRSFFSTLYTTACRIITQLLGTWGWIFPVQFGACWRSGSSEPFAATVANHISSGRERIQRHRRGLSRSGRYRAEL